ncbi:spore germination protein KB [Paenibacillus algorifonticola]|uniref:Spore germination protein KB n=1 Tax=Paenibacillus algorifonticola TaxID=684063 RepID=A0A1I2BZE7_9BACL|nr:GerAB/ArcD/ProY family transporter [Paenibacillus algorifonticola]SFE61302.1 spore germination protein KB [Paenibacillus algorifonticola]
MNKQKVSSFQMGVLFFVFMTGSSVIFVPGPLIGKAGAGAWISLLLSGAVGFSILMMLLYLNRRFPGLDYIDYSRALIGNVLTVFFGLATISYLLQMQAAIVVGVGLFMVGAMMRETPMYAFTALIFLIAACTARAGIEVMARMFTLIMLATTFFIAIVLILAIPEYQPEQLLPILPKGLLPAVSGAYYTFGFPYSEVFLFGMLLPFVTGDKPGKKLLKSMSFAFGANLLALCTVTVCALMVFGPVSAASPFILYSVARLVEFQEIIQRIESIIGISLILGSFMKATLSLYVLSLFIAKLCRLKDNNTLIIPLALTGFLMGLVTYDSNTQWGSIVTGIHPLWTGLALFVPLLILTVVAVARLGKS